MNRRRWSALLLAAALLLLLPAGAQGVILPLAVTGYKVSIDVDLEVTQKTFWKGIRPGCYAPAENFSMTYKLDLDTHRANASSKPTLTGATISAQVIGTGPAIGVKGSFRQSGSPGPWELQIAPPAGCPKAAPPPPWAVSPTCNTISERVAAFLATNVEDESDPDPLALGRDGSLLLTRTPKFPRTSGAEVRPGCWRTLHTVRPVGLFSGIDIERETTTIRVPVPLLQRKLIKLAAGSARARPSFRVDIDVDSYCQAMAMKPTMGRDPEYVDETRSEPHGKIGASFNNEAEQTGCTIEAKGRAIVRREGPVAKTSFRVP